jgi:hypothetical protein
LLPLALRVVGDDPGLRPAVTLLRSWVAAGSHRVDRQRTGSYDHQAAIALFDTWWDNNGAADGGLAKDAVRPVLGSLVDDFPYGTDDHPRQGVGSSWLDVPWYGYTSKALRQALGDHVEGAFSRKYCGDLATCRAALRASLQTAVKRALTAQQVSSVNDLTYDKHLDEIASVTAGVVGVPPIDWQNRPTFQQVVNYTAHRPRQTVHGRSLPATGTSNPVPVGATALGLAAFLAMRLRRRETGRPSGG